jgi:single-strand DNA-binding protein
MFGAFISPLQGPSAATGSRAGLAEAPQNTPGKQPQFHIKNRITLIGFLGRDAEVRNTRNDSSYTVLSLATKTSWKDHAGEWQSRTEWHRCIAWGKFGEFAAALTKGLHLQVEGELRSREYQREGANQRVWEIRTDSILKLDRAERQEDRFRPTRSSPTCPFRARTKGPQNSGEIAPEKTTSIKTMNTDTVKPSIPATSASCSPTTARRGSAAAAAATRFSASVAV